MRIRRLLQISGTAGIASVLMVVATITALLLVLDARHAGAMKTLDDAVRKISVMRSLQPDFTHADNPRATRQWQAVYGELTPILGALPALDEPSRTLKNDVVGQHALVGKLADRLAKPMNEIPPEVREMIAAQLTVRSASMVSDILTVRDMTDRHIRRETQILTILVAASVAVLVAVLLALMRMLQRRIAMPVARLLEATAHLSAGQLDRPVAISGSGDLAELAKGFDDMRIALRERLRDLGEATARLEDAKANLEQRVADRTRELRQAYSQIKELDEAKSRFFSNVSHELRTPLALILGPVEILLTASDVPDDWRRELEVVRRNAQTLLIYVNDLLDLSRIDAGRMRLDYSTADLTHLARLVADHFISAAAASSCRSRRPNASRSRRMPPRLRGSCSTSWPMRSSTSTTRPGESR